MLPENLVGFDVGNELLAAAERGVPGARFFQSAVDAFAFPPESVDVVVSNMVIHHLDNEALAAFLERTYDVLVPEGIFFFVDTDPDYREDGWDHANIDKWLPMETPWGTTLPYFNRHPGDLLDLIDYHGFDMERGWVLRPIPEGATDHENYKKYNVTPTRRMFGRFRKISRVRKDERQDPRGIPALVDMSRPRP